MSQSAIADYDQTQADPEDRMLVNGFRRPPWKIAVVTSFPADPDRPHGGVEAVSVNLVSALARYGDFEIHVVTTDRDCQALSRSTWGRVFIHRLPWLGGHVLSHVLGPGRKHVSRYLQWLSPDLIHAHDFYGIMVRGLPIPRVFTIHGFIHADTRRTEKPGCRLRSWIWRRVELGSWADQPHIVAISPYVRERLQGVGGCVIHDIDNPIAEACFRVKRAEHPNTIFSAAVLGPRKNTLGLLEGFRRLIRGGIPAELRLAGGAADEGYEEEIRRYIDANNLIDRVILLGKISSREVRDELARASVFALVSLEEGAPMGIAEAMAAGVPVVTSNRCGMPYMVRDGETGFLIDPEDPDDIAQALGWVLGDGRLRNRMGRRARQVALDRFHPQCVAARTRRVYLKAMRIGDENH
jgi:glycosyltransferase involved in cell wall biosynthesis